MQVRRAPYFGAVNRSKRGEFEISTGRLVLNYDVDKTSREIRSKRGDTYITIVLYHGRFVYTGQHARIINVMRNVTVNNDQRKRSNYVRSRGMEGVEYECMDQSDRIGAIFVAVPALS